MIYDRLQTELSKVASRYRYLRFWQGLATAWLIAALIGLGLCVWQIATHRHFPFAVMTLATITGIFLVVGTAIALASARNQRWIAQQIESAFPDLRSCLLAAIDQTPELPNGRFGFLQSTVIHNALRHANRHGWPLMISTGRMRRAIVANMVTFSLFLIALAAIMLTAPSASTASSGSLSNSLRSTGDFSVVIEPGNTEIEKGSSLLVLARVTGAVPAESILVYQALNGDETRLNMARSLDDPVFGGRIATVQEALDYRVELGGKTSPSYRVEVFEYPQLDRADANLVFPSYTNLDEKLVQDVRTVTVVEGTRLTLTCYLNKPVRRATLNEDKADPIELTCVDGNRPACQVTMLCDKSRRLKLDLIDEKNRHNVKPWEFVLNVQANQRPTLKPLFPAHDVEVSSLEEIDMKASVWDDFGVHRLGMSYSIGGQLPVDLVLAEHAAAKQKHEFTQTVRLEELNAEADQLLSYYFWVEDLNSAGEVRRTQSDMYFAEVRPFDEVFRQGNQPPGGGQSQQQMGGGQAEAAQKLAELQKDIINGTWKVVRRETGTEVTKEFSPDVELLRTSQASALEQLQTMRGELEDPQSQGHAAAAAKSMESAITRLVSAADESKREPLLTALADEQAAYQGLLKLRAREHRVIRQRQQQGSAGSSSNRSQQQLDQLELKEDEDRYETQRTAQAQNEQQQEDRENKQVLNRLKELARRQHDLNERLKELQTALEEARTEAQKEEIRRQLKRLQEEQKQILEDTDELKSRMESEENQQRMADARQQLEETRENVRRANEALEQQATSQASAAGTRAESEFQNLRDDFRRRTSHRFTEQMREMRANAQELDQKEQELARQLNEMKAEAEQSKLLRDPKDREELGERLNDQQKRLTNLAENMQNVIQESEATEPLLAEKLYDTARQLQDQNTQRALQATEQSLRRGLIDDAQKLEQIANQGIGQLREGIEKAAESVLGDETESLRRAREELNELARAVEDELRRNESPSAETPADRRTAANDPLGDQLSQLLQQASQQPNGQAQSDPQQAGQQPTDQPQGGQPQSSQQRPRPQSGQQQSGQQQSGQQQSGQQTSGQQQADQPQSGRQQSGQEQTRQPQQQPGQSGQQPAAEQQAGQQPGQPQPGQQANPQTGGQNNRRDSEPGGFSGGGQYEYVPRQVFSPTNGPEFRDWSDRLRDVEEMVEDPELRAEAARIREQARSIRAEQRRHSQPPNWDLIRVNVAEPLVELRDRVAEELLRRASKRAIVPLDRDPVPPAFSEKTRLYYERLGIGK